MTAFCKSFDCLRFICHIENDATHGRNGVRTNDPKISIRFHPFVKLVHLSGCPFKGSAKSFCSGLRPCIPIFIIASRSSKCALILTLILTTCYRPVMCINSHLYVIHPCHIPSFLSVLLPCIYLPYFRVFDIYRLKFENTAACTPIPNPFPFDNNWRLLKTLGILPFFSFSSACHTACFFIHLRIFHLFPLTIGSGRIDKKSFRFPFETPPEKRNEAKHPLSLFSYNRNLCCCDP